MSAVRRNLGVTLGLVLLVAYAAFVMLRADKDYTPVDGRVNFVVLIADDLSVDDLSVYGNPDVLTPNIDRLAAQGAVFTNAFLTTSSCSASRGSILTGRYPHSNGLVNLHQPLPGSQLTVGHYLGEAGYYTAAAGKWHLGGEVVDQFDDVDEDRGGRGTGKWVGLLRDRPTDRPFFFWLASRDPHRPHEGGTSYAQHYDPQAFTLPRGWFEGDRVREELAAYYQEVSRFDADVGLVVEELRRQGALDNTLIIVMADNGRPFHGGKLELYSAGIKTPFILHWPEVITEGRTVQQLVSAIDLVPTLLELAGGSGSNALQGYSFAHLLHGGSNIVRDYAFAERNDHSHPAHERAVRSMNYFYKENQFPLTGECTRSGFSHTAPYKALRRRYEAGQLDALTAVCFAQQRAPVELLAVGPGGEEGPNLANHPEYTEIQQEMAGALRRWRQETGDFDYRPAAP